MSADLILCRCVCPCFENLHTPGNLDSFATVFLSVVRPVYLRGKEM